MSTSPADVAAALDVAARTINSSPTVEGTLDAIVHAAKASVPGFDEVGVSIVHHDGTIETKAATGQLVWDLDALQYELGAGPCVEAMRDEPVVMAETIRHDQRWPGYVPRAVEAGLRSQLGVQLFLDERTLGGLNMYSTSSDTIEPDALHAAEMFATHAALALGHARLESQLTDAMASRKAIGMAIGLLMARYEVDQDQAFQFLVRVSSTSNTKLRDVAQEVVRQAERGYRGEQVD